MNVAERTNGIRGYSEDYTIYCEHENVIKISQV